MPKMKSNRAAMKRFRRTGGGGIRRQKAYHGHFFTRKSAKRKRNLRKLGMIAAVDLARVRRLMAGS